MYNHNQKRETNTQLVKYIREVKSKDSLPIDNTVRRTQKRRQQHLRSMKRLKDHCRNKIKSRIQNSSMSNLNLVFIKSRRI